VRRWPLINLTDLLIDTAVAASCQQNLHIPRRGHKGSRQARRLPEQDREILTADDGRAEYMSTRGRITPVCSMLLTPGSPPYVVRHSDRAADRQSPSNEYPMRNYRAGFNAVAAVKLGAQPNRTSSRATTTDAWEGSDSEE
jgi:hypothetical protein